MRVKNPTIFVKLHTTAKISLHDGPGGHHDLGDVVVSEGGAIDVTFINNASPHAVKFGSFWLGVEKGAPNPFVEADLVPLTVNNKDLMVFYANTDQGESNGDHKARYATAIASPLPDGSTFKFWVGAVWENGTLTQFIDPTIKIQN
jgi:hypothetical protein